jgi:hypothetical protein
MQTLRKDAKGAVISIQKKFRTRSGFALHEFKLFQERCKTKWLLEEGGVRGLLDFRKIFGIPRHVNNANFRMTLGDQPGRRKPGMRMSVSRISSLLPHCSAIFTASADV